MKYLTSFPMAYAAVLSLMACVFLMDGCANGRDAQQPPDAAVRKQVSLPAKGEAPCV